MEVDLGNDVITALRSDLAGLQYKRDKLISEVSFYCHEKFCFSQFELN